MLLLTRSITNTAFNDTSNVADAKLLKDTSSPFPNSDDEPPPATTETTQGIVADLVILRIRLSSCVEYKLPELSIVRAFTLELVVATTIGEEEDPCAIFFIVVESDTKRLEPSLTIEIIESYVVVGTKSVTLNDGSIFLIVLLVVSLLSTTYKFPLLSDVILVGPVNRETAIAPFVVPLVPSPATITVFLSEILIEKTLKPVLSHTYKVLLIIVIPDNLLLLNNGSL